ncbi:putative transporter [Saonia flava]|uniref:Putative transporter n=1 Tax=Saonia flava TaxID=523696 RepID=A0A846R1L6_9FLAO|nr:putative transporter [Saonia flava]
MNDIYLSTAMIVILICHLATITVGYKMQKTSLLIPYLNAVIVIGIFIFWAFNSLNIKEHNLENRELFVICMEACILIFALYSIIGFHYKTYAKVINYIGFGIHLLATTGMLYYISIFKFNRLF